MILQKIQIGPCAEPQEQYHCFQVKKNIIRTAFFVRKVKKKLSVKSNLEKHIF